MKRVAGTVYIYKNKIFYNEEDCSNYIRKERLDYILNDIEYKSGMTVKIMKIPEYDKIK